MNPNEPWQSKSFAMFRVISYHTTEKGPMLFKSMHISCSVIPEIPMPSQSSNTFHLQSSTRQSSQDERNPLGIAFTPSFIIYSQLLCKP